MIAQVRNQPPKQETQVRSLGQDPRSKGLVISWLQSLSAVILEPRIIKSVGNEGYKIKIRVDV